MSSNVNTTGADVKITVTDTLNDSIFKSLSRIENNQGKFRFTINEMMLMMEQMPNKNIVTTGNNPISSVNDGVKIDEALEEQIRSAVITTCRRTGYNNEGMPRDVFVDTVIAILKHNDNK